MLWNMKLNVASNRYLVKLKFTIIYTLKKLNGEIKSIFKTEHMNYGQGKDVPVTGREGP
jgi:hypothetical protein